MGVEGGLQLDSSLETGIHFKLKAATLGSASFQDLVPNQIMTIKKVDWTHNRSGFSCAHSLHTLSHILIARTHCSCWIAGIPARV
jgi:hypothetical protein